MPWFVLTAPRPNGADYLDGTLADLEAQGPALPRTLLIDGPGRKYAPPGWRVLDFPGLRGHPAQLQRALDLGRAAGAIVCEDDVRFAPGAVHRVEAFAVPPDLACVQFCSAVAARAAPFGLLRPGSRDIRLLQCVKFSAEACDRLIRLPPPSGDPATWLSRALRALGLGYGCHVPDLLRHVGEVSTYGAHHTLDRCSGTTWQVELDFHAQNLAAFDARGDYR